MGMELVAVRNAVAAAVAAVPTFPAEHGDAQWHDHDAICAVKRQLQVAMTASSRAACEHGRVQRNRLLQQPHVDVAAAAGCGAQACGQHRPVKAPFSSPPRDTPAWSAYRSTGSRPVSPAPQADEGFLTGAGASVAAMMASPDHFTPTHRHYGARESRPESVTRELHLGFL
jgi:hypothetical protein